MAFCRQICRCEGFAGSSSLISLARNDFGLNPETVGTVAGGTDLRWLALIGTVLRKVQKQDTPRGGQGGRSGCTSAFAFSGGGSKPPIRN